MKQFPEYDIWHSRKDNINIFWICSAGMMNVGGSGILTGTQELALNEFQNFFVIRLKNKIYTYIDRVWLKTPSKNFK